MQHLDTWTKRIGHRIAWYDADTKEKRGQIGADTPGERPDQFNWLHSVAIDSEGRFAGHCLPMAWACEGP